MAVLEKLKRQQGFTETEKALADYILAHADMMASMSISQLAEATYSSIACGSASSWVKRIDAAYADALRNKVGAFRREHPSCHKAIHVVMVTPGGTAHNAHYREVVTSEVRGEELFR